MAAVALTTDTGTNETALVQAAQRGDIRAFDALVRRYRSAAVTIARQFLSGEMAEDAAQDALISAFRSLKGLDDPARFKAWLGAIVRNRAIRMARDRSRTDTMPMHELDRLVLSGAPSLSTHLAEPRDEIHRVVEGLPAGIRETIRLYYFESWSVSEIAVFTARPVTTVKWQLHAGRELLRRKLSPLEENTNANDEHERRTTHASRTE
ncbi:MAG TPA: sigma-70 family RNA polymerase sigma factor [Fimbriimonas sp.]